MTDRRLVRRPSPDVFWDSVLMEAWLRQEMLDFVEHDLWPWRFPNPNPFPEFILFPRLARLERKVKR